MMDREINFGGVTGCRLAVGNEEFILLRASVCIIHYSSLHFRMYTFWLAAYISDCRRPTLSEACDKQISDASYANLHFNKVTSSISCDFFKANTKIVNKRICYIAERYN